MGSIARETFAFSYGAFWSWSFPAFRMLFQEGQLQSAPLIGHCDQARLLSSYLSRELMKLMNGGIDRDFCFVLKLLSISTADRRPACFEVQRKMALLHCALVSPRTHGEWQTAPGDGRAPVSLNSCVYSDLKRQASD